ncbi:MAG: hypothetical protein GKR90_02100 [Pseudomonadales bacterium]|nr:hypothetical protein [Pseudomonadales bacterium]
MALLSKKSSSLSTKKKIWWVVVWRPVMMGLTLAGVVALGSCTANPPNRTNDVCAVFEQKSGWLKAARKAERKWGMPVHIGMAFVNRESSYVANAKPPRRRLLGLVPWTRLSSAYGYAQATDEAWTDYEKETDRWFTDRDNFSDAMDFVGWYNHRTHKALGIAKSDVFRLYLAYYTGLSGYRKGHWRSERIQGYARKVQQQSKEYARQLQRCS